MRQQRFPLINECLQLNIDPESYDDKFSRESPDFVFSNNDKSIGVEVVECHPSVRKCKTRNAVEQESFEKKICDEFKKSRYLEIITETEKLNLRIYRKYPKEKKRGTVQEVCHELEDLLKSWYQKTNSQSERNYISYIRVLKTTCCNVVYFNNTSRCIPVNWDDIKFCIEKKEKKYKDYCNNTKCDEYWLCICLPFKESIHPSSIDYNGKENETIDFLTQSPFSRIFLTPDSHGREINWIKEGNILIDK